MAKRDISPETMIEITEEWLSPKGKAILTSLPIISAMIPVLEQVRADLLEKQVAPPPADVAAKIAAIHKKQSGLDRRHDRKMRGAIWLLDALAQLTDDPAAAQRYLELRDMLCPDGLKGTLKSYTDESGAAKLLRGRLDDTAKQDLAAIAVPGATLLDVVNDWMETAEKLGALDKDKSALVDDSAAPAGKTPKDALDARNAWIRFASALETTLAISGADQETIDALLKPVREAEAKAEKKKGAGAPATEGEGGEGGEVAGEAKPG